MFDVAKAGDEKAGSGECQLTSKGKWSGLPICSNDHELNLLPGLMVTVGMISFRYHAGRSNSFYCRQGGSVMHNDFFRKEGL